MFNRVAIKGSALLIKATNYDETFLMFIFSKDQTPPWTWLHPLEYSPGYHVVPGFLAILGVPDLPKTCENITVQCKLNQFIPTVYSQMRFPRMHFLDVNPKVDAAIMLSLREKVPLQLQVWISNVRENRFSGQLKGRNDFWEQFCVYNWLGWHTGWNQSRRNTSSGTHRQKVGMERR